MIDYSTQIQQLLSIELDQTNDSTYFLSIYQPNTGLSKDQIKLRLKSQIQEVFRQGEFKQEVKGNLKLKSKIIEPVFEEVDKLQDIEQGLALFVKFDLERNKKIALNDQLYVLPLVRTPKKEARLLGSFDLDQLLASAYQQIDAVVVSLHRKTFRVYQLIDSQLKVINHQENDHIGEMPDDYLEQHAPIDQKQGIFHGSGSDVHQRRLLKQNELFMDDLIQYFTSELENELKLGCKFIFVYYSDYFQEIIDQLKEAVEDKSNSGRVVLIQKTLYNDKQVKEHASKKYQQLKQKRKKQLAAELKESYYQAKKGWAEVTEAARMGQVKRLLIKPDLKKTGYVTQDNLIYTYPAKDSTKVDNIAPWLVSAVKNQSGQVRVMAGDEYGDYPSVMAELRYKLD